MKREVSQGLLIPPPWDSPVPRPETSSCLSESMSESMSEPMLDLNVRSQGRLVALTQVHF